MRTPRLPQAVALKPRRLEHQAALLLGQAAAAGPSSCTGLPASVRPGTVAWGGSGRGSSDPGGRQDGDAGARSAP